MGSWKIDAMWRRIGWYLVACMVMTIPILWWARSYEQPQPDYIPVALGGSFTACALLFVGWLNHVRFRLDDEGLHRRLLVRWDTWPWEDFESGRIEYVAEAAAFRDPRRPWWRRGIALAYLSDENRQAVVDAVLARWHAPMPEPGDTLELTLRPRLLRRVKVLLDHGGVTVEDSRGSVYVPWREVDSVWVVRQRPEQPDFRTLRLVLPTRDIVLWRQVQDAAPRQHWRGPDGATVLALLQRRLPPEKLHIGHLNSEPVEVEDLLLRAVVHRKQAREGLRLGGTIALLCVGLPVASIVLGEHLHESLAMSAMMLFALAVMAYQARRLRREVTAVEARLSEVLGADVKAVVASARFALSGL